MSSRFRFESMGIGRLLKQGHLVVPANQRPYAWEDRHVRDLFQDLNGALLNNDDDYFLGTIVLVQSGHENPSIADGQQRICTTTILLARIRDRLIFLKRSGSARSIDDGFLRHIDVDTEDMLPRVRLNIEDNDFFTNNILPSPDDENYKPYHKISAVRPSNKKLLRASILADEFISEMTAGLPITAHSDHLVKWSKFIESSATVVVVTAPDEIGAFRIFETLNDRGLRASQADILKNYLFSKAGNRLVEAQSMWNTIMATLDTLGDEEGDRLVTFLRHYWITTHGPTKERELAAKMKLEMGGETKTMQFLSELSKAVQDYVAVWSFKHPKWATYASSTKQHLETINEHLKVEQIRPLLFSVARHFDPIELSKAYKLFVSWSVRFLIFGGRGGMLDMQ